jgi:hypothetical protein
VGLVGGEPGAYGLSIRSEHLRQIFMYTFYHDPCCILQESLVHVRTRLVFLTGVSLWLVLVVRKWFGSLRHPPNRQKRKDMSLCQALSQSQTNLGLLRWKTTYIFKNRRRPQYFKNGRQIQKFSKLDDKFNFFQKWKTNSIFSKMEDDLNFLEKGRQFKSTSSLTLLY